MDRLIHGAGVDLAGPVAVDRRGDVAEQPGQLRLVVGADRSRAARRSSLVPMIRDRTVFRPVRRGWPLTRAPGSRHLRAGLAAGADRPPQRLSRSAPVSMAPAHRPQCIDRWICTVADLAGPACTATLTCGHGSARPGQDATPPGHQGYMGPCRLLAVAAPWRDGPGSALYKELASLAHEHVRIQAQRAPPDVRAGHERRGTTDHGPP